MSPMNNRLLVPRKVPGLLDLVPGAAAAYSLRSLSNSYADPVVTVRRSSDDAEEDFTAAEVADGTLAAFCGAGDGFVKQWWDQSGSANHAVAAADTNEPKIVDGGVVVTEEGKPALQFDGTDDYLSFVSTITVSRYTNIAVYANNAIKTSAIIGLDNGQSLGMWSDQRIYENNGILSQYVSTLYPFDEEMHIVSITKSGDTLADFECHKDGVLLAAYTGTPFVSISLKYIGGRLTPAAYFDGTISELIIYPSDQTAQRELIEGNIAWSYSV